jgi:hypothetical protein
MFDALVDELRTHSTEWVESRRRELTEAMKPGRGQPWVAFEPRAAAALLALLEQLRANATIEPGLVGNPDLPDGLERVTASRGPPLVPA